MLTLLVGAKDFTFAICALNILEVIPRVIIKAASHDSGLLLGHINWAGKAIPVADLSILIEGPASRNCMHTRIVLLNEKGSYLPQLGLIAEKVTTVIDLDENKFVASITLSRGLPFLGGVFNRGEDPIQLIKIPELFEYLHIR